MVMQEIQTVITAVHTGATKVGVVATMPQVSFQIRCAAPAVVVSRELKLKLKKTAMFSLDSWHQPMAHQLMTQLAKQNSWSSYLMDMPQPGPRLKGSKHLLTLLALMAV